MNNEENMLEDYERQCDQYDFIYEITYNEAAHWHCAGCPYLKGSPDPAQCVCKLAELAADIDYLESLQSTDEKCCRGFTPDENCSGDQCTCLDIKNCPCCSCSKSVI